MAASARARSAKSQANVATEVSSDTSNSNEATSFSMDALVGLQATLEKTMQEMSQVSGILKQLQEDVSTVKSAQAKTTMDINNMRERLDDADGRFMHMEVENERLSSELQKRAKQCDELERALQEAESRERLLNLRLVGIEENQDGNLRVLARQCIDETLGVKLNDNEIQRAFRSGAQPTEEDAQPRPIVLRFLSLLERDRVLTAVKSKYKQKAALEWKGAKISLFPDASRAVVERRRKFTPVRNKLHDMDIRFTLAYPAKLYFTWKGKKMSFEDHRKAQKFLDKETNGSD